MTKRMKILLSAALALVLALVLIGAVYAWRVQTPRYSIPMAAGETVTNWSYTGTYTTDAERTKAQEKIERLKKLFGTDEFTDYEINVSIANEYASVGDGKNELKYIERALAEDAGRSGLAWHNAGVLFEKLGAIATARYAHEQALRVQPIAQFRTALVAFLERHYPDDREAIKQAEEAGSGSIEL